jgi:hypothetical protein
MKESSKKTRHRYVSNIKGILDKVKGVKWSELMWLRMGASGGLVLIRH